MNTEIFVDYHLLKTLSCSAFSHELCSWVLRSHEPGRVFQLEPLDMHLGSYRPGRFQAMVEGKHHNTNCSPDHLTVFDGETWSFNYNFISNFSLAIVFFFFHFISSSQNYTDLAYYDSERAWCTLKQHVHNTGCV